MSIFKFIGNGSCFDTAKVNTSCYYRRTDNLLLIDCGENVFKEILKLNLLNDIKNLYISITHFHSDHIGSLPSLIFYCNIVLKMKVSIIYPQQENLNTLLTLMGVNKYIYNYINPETEQTVFENVSIKSSISIHDSDIVAFSYLININDEKIFYSGDNAILNQKIKKMFENDEIKYWYQDVSSHGNGHLSIDVLDKEIKLNRDRIFCIHLENEDMIDKINKLGFKTPSN